MCPGGPSGRAHPSQGPGAELKGGGQGLRGNVCASSESKQHVFSSTRPLSVTPAALSDKKQNKREMEVDSIISAVSSLFIQDLQRSISLLLS